MINRSIADSALPASMTSYPSARSARATDVRINGSSSTSKIFADLDATLGRAVRREICETNRVDPGELFVPAATSRIPCRLGATSLGLFLVEPATEHEVPARALDSAEG